MRIIISPAKTMKKEPFPQESLSIPRFMDKTQEILSWLQLQSREELQKLWKCNDKIAEENIQRLKTMDLQNMLTPAVLAYDGMVFKHIAPCDLSKDALAYMQDHLRILSAFYGVLKPMDGITSYRLEMQSKASVGTSANLYDFWKDKLYHAVKDESGIIVNLASKEYSKCIENYLMPQDIYVTISFYELVHGNLVTKGTYAKMARGEMVRFLAEENIQTLADIQRFNRLGYFFMQECSSEKEYVFCREDVSDK